MAKKLTKMLVWTNKNVSLILSKKDSIHLTLDKLLLWLYIILMNVEGGMYGYS